LAKVSITPKFLSGYQASTNKIMKAYKPKLTGNKYTPFSRRETSLI